MWDHQLGKERVSLKEIKEEAFIEDTIVVVEDPTLLNACIQTTLPKVHESLVKPNILMYKSINLFFESKIVCTMIE